MASSDFFGFKGKHVFVSGLESILCFIVSDFSFNCFMFRH